MTPLHKTLKTQVAKLRNANYRRDRARRLRESGYKLREIGWLCGRVDKEQARKLVIQGIADRDGRHFIQGEWRRTLMEKAETPREMFLAEIGLKPNCPAAMEVGDGLAYPRIDVDE